MSRTALALSLVALASPACNWIFGLRSTEVVDAAFFDAPPDAPFRCPPPGQPPVFSQQIVQAIPRNCFFYSDSSDRKLAAAICGDAVNTGPIDGALEAATLSGVGATSMFHVRVTP